LCKRKNKEAGIFVTQASFKLKNLHKERKALLEEEGEVNGLEEKPCVGEARYRTFFGYMNKVSRM